MHVSLRSSIKAGPLPRFGLLLMSLSTAGSGRSPPGRHNAGGHRGRRHAPSTRRICRVQRLTARRLTDSIARGRVSLAGVATSARRTCAGWRRCPGTVHYSRRCWYAAFNVGFDRPVVRRGLTPLALVALASQPEGGHGRTVAIGSYSAWAQLAAAEPAARAAAHRWDSGDHWSPAEGRHDRRGQNAPARPRMRRETWCVSWFSSRELANQDYVQGGPWLPLFTGS